MTPCVALARMMAETGTEEACTLAIGEVAPWPRLSDPQKVERMRQCLRHAAGRRFCADWQTIVLEIVAEAGGSDYVTAVLDQARREGEHARRRMLKVEPDAVRDRVGRRA